MYKKVLFLLALLAAPNFVSASFPDVAQSDVFYDAVNYVQDKGIVEGYPNGTFKSWSMINRAEFTKILVGAAYDAEEIESCTGYTFPDVPENEWYAPYVCTAKKHGLVDGYPDGTFKPDMEIIFAEAAKIIVNTIGPEPVGLELSSGQWYTPYVNALSGVNAIPVEITGYATEFTRGQMAEIVYRLKENITDKPSLKPEEIGFQNKIQAYYDAISFNRLDDAYAMKVDAGMTLEEFKAMYADFQWTSARDYVKERDNVFSFIVVTYDVEFKNSELYQVTMELVGDKLKTLSSQKTDEAVLLELAFDENLKAEIRWSDGKYDVVVTKDGSEATAYTVDTAQSMAGSLRDLNFSGSGRYLTFTEMGWEWAGLNVYDTVTGNINDTMLNGVDLFGFTGGEKYFYFCSETGMSSGKAVVLNLPDMTVRRLLADSGENVTSCGPYDAATNSLHYKMIDEDTWEEKQFIYYIETDAEELI